VAWLVSSVVVACVLGALFGVLLGIGFGRDGGWPALAGAFVLTGMTFLILNGIVVTAFSGD
jgi:hypothetical protein